MFYKNQKGASHLIAVLLIVVIAVVGAAGYYVYQKNKDTQNKSATSQTTPQQIQSERDVDAAVKALDTLPTDSEIDANQLDDDLNQLL